MSLNLPEIRQFNDEPFNDVCERLVAMRPEINGAQEWPKRQMALFCESGATAIFIPAQYGGAGWSNEDRLRAMLRFSESCLASTFVLSQHLGALKRVLFRSDEPYFRRRIGSYLSGSRFASLGLSHLHAKGRTSLTAEFVKGGISLRGRIPWVTGASRVHDVYIGARVDADTVVFALCAMSSSATIIIDEPGSLAALSETETASISFRDHFIPTEHVLGVGDDIRFGLSTGGANGCAMALGHAGAALSAMERLASEREDSELSRHVSGFNLQWCALRDRLLSPLADLIQLRSECNAAALSFSQSLLLIQRGSGFHQGMLAQHLCRQALFFLVWSNPLVARDHLLTHWSGLTLN